MKMLLVGIGQETPLDKLDQTKNFLLFEREDGTDFRVHVDQEAVREVILASSVPQVQESEHAQEFKARIALEEQATEFGGDAEEPDPQEFMEEPPEQYGDEDEVPSV